MNSLTCVLLTFKSIEISVFICNFKESQALRERTKFQGGQPGALFSNQPKMALRRNKVLRKRL